MTKPRLHYYEPKYVRDSLRAVEEKSMQLHAAEKELIEMLDEIDHKRFFIRFGYRSLRAYLVQDLKFTRTQAQRIVTEVRRNRTTFDIGPAMGLISHRYSNYFKSRGRSSY